MHNALFAILACPICRGNLLHDKKKQELICTVDQVAYSIKSGIPIMMVHKARKLSKKEHKEYLIGY